MVSLVSESGSVGAFHSCYQEWHSFAEPVNGTLSRASRRLARISTRSDEMAVERTLVAWSASRTIPLRGVTS